MICLLKSAKLYNHVTSSLMQLYKPANHGYRPSDPSCRLGPLTVFLAFSAPFTVNSALFKYSISVYYI